MTSGLTEWTKGKVLGRVDDTWVARELILAYFADKDVISPKVGGEFRSGRIACADAISSGSQMKEDVAHGLEEFIKH